MPKQKTTTNDPAPHPLVGCWFHSYRAETPDIIRWQGQVLACLNPDTFLVQLYEWGIGNPSNQCLVSLADMKLWAFYRTNAAMLHAYDDYCAKRNAEFERTHPIELRTARERSTRPDDKQVH